MIVSPSHDSEFKMRFVRLNLPILPFKICYLFTQHVLFSIADGGIQCIIL